MTLLTIIDTRTGEQHSVFNSAWYGAGSAKVYGHKTVLAYWETRYELAMWACEKLGLDPYKCEYINPRTLEIMDYNDLEMEYFDTIEEMEA